MTEYTDKDDLTLTDLEIDFSNLEKCHLKPEDIQEIEFNIISHNTEYFHVPTYNKYEECLKCEQAHLTFNYNKLAKITKWEMKDVGNWAKKPFLKLEHNPKNLAERILYIHDIQSFTPTYINKTKNIIKHKINVPFADYSPDNDGMNYWEEAGTLPSFKNPKQLQIKLNIDNPLYDPLFIYKLGKLEDKFIGKGLQF